MRSGREELRDTGSVEASLGKTKGGAQTGTTGANNNGIVLMVLFSKSERDCRGLPKDFALKRRTMTGYLLLRKGEASFARRGPLAMTRAVFNPTLAHCDRFPALKELAVFTYKLVASLKRLGSVYVPAAKTMYLGGQPARHFQEAKKKRRGFRLDEG